MGAVEERLHRARTEAARLRSWSSRIAADVAATELKSASLLEDLAETVPDQAEQLRQQAASARSFAETERRTAAADQPLTDPPD